MAGVSDSLGRVAHPGYCTGARPGLGDAYLKFVPIGLPLVR